MKIFVGLLASALGAPAPAIIGGSNASDGQFPHQVTLQNRGSHYCGGSIINTNKVMCAAHCKQSGTLTAGAGSASRTRQRQTKVSHRLLVIGQKLKFSEFHDAIGSSKLQLPDHRLRLHDHHRIRQLQLRQLRQTDQDCQLLQQ